MQNVAGKVAFITGGASGLGLSMARAFTGAGMKVVLADIEDQALEKAASELAKSNAEVITLKVDVTNRDEMADAAVRTVEAFDKIHVLCNNAGVALSGNISDMSYKDWDWVMNVNLHGVINGMVSFIDHIKSHDEGGHIVNTSSIAGQFGMAGLSIYSTTKFAVVGMSEAMRVDLAPFNIGTSVLCPGGVATNILTSERNRPDSLRGENTHSYQSGPVVQAANDGEQRRPQMLGVLPPDTIGDMVLDAIQNDVFYILSHPQFKNTIAQRGQELSDAADRWHAYLQRHSG